MEMGLFFERERGRISARLCEIAGIDGSEKVSDAIYGAYKDRRRIFLCG